MITSWQQRRAQLPTPDAQRQWLFPTPLLRARQSRGHITPACVARAFKVWVAKIGTIDSELPGPDGTPLPFEPSLITPYALRHSYAQRHADAGVPVDVLKELMDHVAVATTMGYYQISLKRKQQAIRAVGLAGHRRRGQPAPFARPTGLPAGIGVGAVRQLHRAVQRQGRRRILPDPIPVRRLRLYRPDPSYLPAIEEHIASLRADFETARAMDAAELRAGQPHRRDRRVRHRSRQDAARPGRTRPRASALRSRRPARSCAVPAPPGRCR